MRADALDYDLPEELIATQAAEPRDASRLMLIQRQADAVPDVAHHHVRDLPGLGLLRSGDLLVVNQTRVAKAYFRGVRTQTGGHVKGLYLEDEAPAADGHPVWRLLLESRGKPQPGENITLDENAHLTLIDPLGFGEWRATLSADVPTLAVLERLGNTPLPPYIRKARKHRDQAEVTEQDQQRYNTVFAHDDPDLGGASVAAPTAGLHFTPQLLETLVAQGVQRAEVTLHVGMGTFAPVRSEKLEDHPMHTERFHVPGATLRAIRDTRARSGRVIPIGTTTVRSLESLPTDWETYADTDAGYAASTDLLIQPGPNGEPWGFRFTDALMTNFHLPASTLLALVAALPNVGLASLLHCYETAVAERYRFFSYGDAMLIV